MGRGNPTEEEVPALVVVYFTAKWCKKCKTFDLDKIREALPHATWYKNDIDENENTYAYCSLHSIPSFVVLKNKKYMGKFDTDAEVKNIKEKKEGVTQENTIAWLKQFV